MPLSFSRLSVVLCAATLAAFCLPAVAQEKDELWDITMKMEMPGVPMNMAQTYSGKRVGSCTAPPKGK